MTRLEHAHAEKPKSLYDVADEFRAYFCQGRIERVEYVEKSVNTFSAETLRFAEQCAKEYPELAVRDEK